MSNKVSSLRILNYGKIKAICDIVIADAVVVHGVRAVEGKDGLFVSFPCERKVDWEGVVRHYDIVHPITAGSESRADRDCSWRVSQTAGRFE